MKETKEIIEAYTQAERQGKKTALATVVQVEGSSYRAPGARMLVTEDGLIAGAISGGCLEADALRKALMVIMQHKPLLVTYRTTDEEEPGDGISLGCNGVIRVLIEPVDAADPQNPRNPVSLLQQALQQRSPAVMVTLFSMADHRDARQGTHALILEDQAHDMPFAGVLSGEITETFASQRSRLVPFTGSGSTQGQGQGQGAADMTAFLQYLPPGISLIIAGAGGDVLPVVQMAGCLGWGITLIDGRPGYAKSPRFAQCQVIVAAPEEALLDPVLHSRSACLLMSHNYRYDKAMMRRLSGYGVPYIGMLGPLKKRERMLRELEAEGVSFTGAQLDCIHSPAGLDIGAETPEEIACSIIAEISMFFSGGTGRPLRTFTGSVHHREGAQPK